VSHVTPGEPIQKSHVKLCLTINGREYWVYGGCYSEEGGGESLFYIQRDALQLAAHELGWKQAKSSPPGVYVLTAAGKDFFSRLEPFQKSKLPESEDIAQAFDVIKQDVEFRMMEIYEQLLKWPQSPLAPLQGDR
jgi:hypothetical protein